MVATDVPADTPRHGLEVDTGCPALRWQRDACATEAVPDGAFGDVQVGGDGADAGAGLDVLQQTSRVVDVRHSSDRRGQCEHCP